MHTKLCTEQIQISPHFNTLEVKLQHTKEKQKILKTEKICNKML